MKQIIIFIIFIFTFSSCQKFLQEVPKDRITETNFYKTPADAQAAVNAIYGPIRAEQLYGDQYLLQIEIPADYAYGRGSTMPIGGEYTGLDATNADRVGKIWASFYRSINYANIVLEKIPKIVMKKSTEEALLAEARFMRAFSYYNLVRDWGAVPLRLNTQEGDMARTPVDSVYNAIIADLQVAEKDLPTTISEEGHPSKWAAKTMLADVYLTMGKWSKARDMAKDVMDNGPYALVQIKTLDDWNKLFGASVNGSPEEIFYIKYNHQTAENGWPFYLNYANTTKSAYGAYVLYSDPTNPFIINWNNNDLRKQWDVFTVYKSSITGKIDTLVFPPMCFSKFRDPDAPSSRASANDFPIYRYADVLLIYAESEDMAGNGPSPLAIESLNKIKRRGYGYPSGSPSPVDYPSTGWTKESFRAAVLQERAYEFMSEGKRWFDLKRSGTAKEVILAHLGKVVANRFMLWPIPLQEIETNPKINQADQNPGY